MPSRIRRRTAGVLGAALLAGAVLGCARDEGEHFVSVGGARSACELPVTLEIPTPWKKKSLDEDAADKKRSRYSPCHLELGTGKTALALRVDVYDKGRTKTSADPLKALLDYDGQGMSNYGEYYHDEYENRLTIAGHPAAQMGYTVKPPDSNVPTFRRRMFAVVTPDATIVVRVGGDNPGADERTRALYDRVKSSLRFAS
ncbi:lipoprotein [Streptomyces yunnanensis]|uniref:Lipoprotein n=1 Tax=Streptomyces yunnanensis TaxID=156453 RepID=A0ABY8A5T9_9ACTN|nr:lipoprotein [Streptomyces yunnanensis]WEB39666.1 lipoprotein [Streptomyces yunnanensis]